MAISSNTALFSLLGTQYGGNGTSNFQLPNMQGRFPVGQGQGPGLQDFVIGQTGGSETVTLSVENLPAHNHSVSIATGQISASSVTANSAVPSGNSLANTGRNLSYNATAPDVSLGTPVSLTGFTAATGGGQAFSIMPPYLTVNCIIALQGIFPARN